MANVFSSRELTDPQILSYLHDIGDKAIIFYGFKIGPRCNGDIAYPFTHAECDLRTIRCKDLPSLKLNILDPVAISFSKIFHSGLALLRRLQQMTTVFSETEESALKVLDSYFLKKGKQCLAIA